MAFERLSPRSVYRRFLHPVTALTPAVLRQLTELDFCDHVALVLAVEDESGERLIAVGRFVRVAPCSERAEFAITVADDYQNRGAGMLLLQRFSPLGVREPLFSVETGRVRAPLTRAALVMRGLAGGLVGLAIGAGSTALLAATRTMRTNPEIGFDLGAPVLALLYPEDLGAATTTAGVVVFAIVTGLLTAAAVVARRGGGGAAPDLD